MSGGFRAGPTCHLSSRKQNKSPLVFSRSGVWSLVGWLVSVMWQMLHCTFPPRNDQLETFLARKGGLCPPFFWTDKITVSTAKYNYILRGRNRRVKLYYVHSCLSTCQATVEKLKHAMLITIWPGRWYFPITIISRGHIFTTLRKWILWSRQSSNTLVGLSVSSKGMRSCLYNPNWFVFQQISYLIFCK